jgi:hypothetical protein
MSSVYYDLGMLQIPQAQVHAAFKLVHDRANVQHTMGARGYADLYRGSEPTGKRLVYDSGIDGTDGKYWVEDIPKHTLHLEMDDEQWAELRRVLTAAALHGEPYIYKLYNEGKLGKL